jgi:hypothetical protein
MPGTATPIKPPVCPDPPPKDDPDFISTPQFLGNYYCCVPDQFLNGSGFVCPNPLSPILGGCEGAFISCDNVPQGRCHILSSSSVCNNFSFPTVNTEGAPMLKTPLNGTTMAPFAKIAFEQYDKNGCIDVQATASTIITMGNCSQCGAVSPACETSQFETICFNCGAQVKICGSEICKAAIKSFQYGFGVKQQGNTCKVTIVDEKGSEFSTWVQRIVKNLEGAATPVGGVYRMKCQFGWYITGGDPADVCGQDATVPTPYSPTTPAPPGLNTAYLVLSPVMYFLPNWINVNFDRNKFIYQLEGVDTLARGQETFQMKTYGTDKSPMYLTRAITELGRDSQPQFRVQFRALDTKGQIIDLQFVKRENTPGDRACKCDESFDGEGYGPLGVWRTGNKPPLEAINDWLTSWGVAAFDTSGYSKSAFGRVGMTANYDSTFVQGSILPTADSRCTSGTGIVDGIGTCAITGGTPDVSAKLACPATNPNCIPQYGSLIVWADSLVWCNNNLSDTFWDARMKAVYLVNGGNCGSPVLSFNPSLRWHFYAGLATGGSIVPANGTPDRQADALVKTNCRIASSNGPAKVNVVPATDLMNKTGDEKGAVQQAAALHLMANLPMQAIEAELVVQGDPSPWLCSPLLAYGRSVGIVFINPFFLDKQDNTTGCPQWLACDPDPLNPGQCAPGSSICNNILTNKGWLILGVDHQITDGKYITTIKLYLPAPGAETQDSNVTPPPPPPVPPGPPVPPPPTPPDAVSLGGWNGGNPSAANNTMPYGGRFSPVSSYAVGSDSVGWVDATSTDPSPTWVAGGEAGDDGYNVPSDIPA